MIRRFGLCLAMLCLVSAPASTMPDDPIFDRWVVENGRAVIELRPCGETACGYLVWLLNPNTADGMPKQDTENDDPTARTRPLCGLKLITGLSRAETGVWEDGKIYSTRDGKSFNLKVSARDDGTLAVRGFIGISLFGKTQTWQREDGTRGNCVTLGAPGNNR